MVATTRARSAPGSATGAATTTSTKKTTSSAAPSSKPSKPSTATSKPASAAASAKAATSGSKGGAAGAGASLPASTPQLQKHDDEAGTTSLTQLVAVSAKGIIVFFYPAANTPGCTNQAKLFQEHLSKFTAKGYSVYGCSKDKPSANAKWHTKLGLAYPLLTDADARTAELVGLLKSPGRKMQRGVAIIDKVAADGSGSKIVLAGPYGPQASVDAALAFVGAA